MRVENRDRATAVRSTTPVRFSERGERIGFFRRGEGFHEWAEGVFVAVHPSVRRAVRRALQIARREPSLKPANLSRPFFGTALDRSERANLTACLDLPEVNHVAPAPQSEGPEGNRSDKLPADFEERDLLAGRNFPNVDLSEAIAGRNQPIVRAEGGGPNGILMGSLQYRNLLSGLRLPETDGAVDTHRDNPSSIGAERNKLDHPVYIERLDFDRRLLVPEPNRSVDASRGDIAPVGGERQRLDIIQVPPQHADFPPRLPDADGMIMAPGDDEPAVRCKRNGADAVLVPPKDFDLRAGLFFPKAEGPIALAGENLLSIGTEGDRDDKTGNPIGDVRIADDFKFSDPSAGVNLPKKKIELTSSGDKVPAVGTKGDGENPIMLALGEGSLGAPSASQCRRKRNGLLARGNDEVRIGRDSAADQEEQKKERGRERDESLQCSDPPCASPSERSMCRNDRPSPPSPSDSPPPATP